MAVDDCGELLGWAAQIGMRPGTVQVVQLPERWRHLAADASGTLLRTLDGRLCLLLKTHIGWKGNFDGLLCCDQPLRENEVHIGEGARPYISISSFPIFEELYLRESTGHGQYQVYFDLY